MNTKYNQNQILKGELIISELFPIEYHAKIWKGAKKKKQTPLEFIISTVLDKIGK